MVGASAIGGASSAAPPRSPRQPSVNGAAVQATSTVQRSLLVTSSSSASSATAGPILTAAHIGWSVAGGGLASMSPLTRSALQASPAPGPVVTSGVQALASQGIVTHAGSSNVAASAGTAAHVVLRRSVEVASSALASGPGVSIGAWPGLRDQTPAALRPAGAPSLTVTAPTQSVHARHGPSISSTTSCATTTTIAASTCSASGGIPVLLGSASMGSSSGVGTAIAMSSMSSGTAVPSAHAAAAASGNGTPLSPFPGQASPRALFSRSSRDM